MVLSHRNASLSVAAIGVIFLATRSYAATIVLSPATTTVDDVELNYQTSPWTTSTGTDGNFSGGAPGGLLGYRDLFTLIPVTSGGNPIAIDSATLRITSNFNNTATNVSVFRVTTPWLTDVAGQNQLHVNSHFRNIAGGLEWTTNLGWNQTFGASDYDAASASVGTVLLGEYNEVTTFDVTNAVSSLFASGVNQGFVVVGNNSGYIRAQESGMGPELSISYHYVPEPASAAVIALTGGLITLRRRRAAE